MYIIYKARCTWITSLALITWNPWISQMFFNKFIKFRHSVYELWTQYCWVYISVLHRACLTDSDCNQREDNYKCEDEVCKCDSSKFREVDGRCQSCKNIPIFHYMFTCFCLMTSYSKSWDAGICLDIATTYCETRMMMSSHKHISIWWLYDD